MIVTNTGPLIALAKIDRLSLLPQLFNDILTPPAVQRELLAKIGREGSRLDNALSHFIVVTKTPKFPLEVELTTALLDQGERQAIALAYQEKCPLLIDERLGRIAAQRLSLTIMGTVGILLEAKERGLVTAVHPLLQDMRQQGYWLSDKLLATAARIAGEG
jgi:predicted nucleic acid-binding protein